MKPPHRGGRPPGGASSSGGPRPPSRGPTGGGARPGPPRGASAGDGARRDGGGREPSGRDGAGRDGASRDGAGRNPGRFSSGGTDYKPYNARQGRGGSNRPAGERAVERGPDRSGDRATSAATPPPDQGSRPNRLFAPIAAPQREPRGENRPSAPKGTVWLYGLHAVAGALANPARRLRRLILTEEAEAALSAMMPPPWSIQPERSERARIDHLLGRDAVHQGAALLADPLAPPALTQILERPGNVLVLDQVVDPRNVGAILRSAAAFGIAAVITQERNAPEETGALAKAASGALEKIPLLRAVNIARTLIALKAAGCWVIGLAADGKPLSGPALVERRVALVLGNEGEGLRRLTRDTCDEIAGLAMPRGHASEMESLNVSAAAAVALYELGRQA